MIAYTYDGMLMITKTFKFPILGSRSKHDATGNSFTNQGVLAESSRRDRQRPFMIASPAWWLEAGSRSQTARVPFLPLSPSSDMNLDVVFKLSVPVFPHQQNRVVVIVK